MTFEAQEEGDGYPVELYEFRLGLTESFFLTSHDAEIDFQSNTYIPQQMQRQSVEQNTEIERQELKIDIQRDADILAIFVAFPPTEIMTLTIFRQHLNDPASEFVVVWKGRVLTVEWSGSKAAIACEPVFTSLKRPGLRRKYQSQCPHIHYGAECKVNNLAFQVIGTISSFTPNTITAPEWAATAAEFYNGGYVVFNSVNFRTVLGDDGAGTLTLVARPGAEPFTDIEIGSAVEAFPGCNHDLADCNDRYSNVENYGGFPYSPDRNPFGGTILY